MGPYVRPRQRPWEPEVYTQPAPAPTPRYPDSVADQMRQRWDQGHCPCGCGMTLDELRTHWPDLYHEYAETGVWTGAWTS